MMELDVSPPAAQERILTVPDEIWIKIIAHLEPLDVLALGRSCRRLNKFVDSDTVWRGQWVRLAKKLPWISFPSVHSLVTLGVQFKDSCRRLWCIVAAEGGLYPKCVHCKVLFQPLFLHFNGFLFRITSVITAALRNGHPKLSSISGASGPGW